MDSQLWVRTKKTPNALCQMLYYSACTYEGSRFLGPAITGEPMIFKATVLTLVKIWQIGSVSYVKLIHELSKFLLCLYFVLGTGDGMVSKVTLCGFYHRGLANYCSPVTSSPLFLAFSPTETHLFSLA